MDRSTLAINGESAASAGLAAAIAMMFGCLISFFLSSEAAGALIWGTWCAAVAFGGTYASCFFVALAKRGRAGS